MCVCLCTSVLHTATAGAFDVTTCSLTVYSLSLSLCLSIHRKIRQNAYKTSRKQYKLTLAHITIHFAVMHSYWKRFEVIQNLTMIFSEQHCRYSILASKRDYSVQLSHLEREVTTNSWLHFYFAIFKSKLNICSFYPRHMRTS